MAYNSRRSYLLLLCLFLLFHCNHTQETFDLGPFSVQLTPPRVRVIHKGTEALAWFSADSGPVSATRVEQSVVQNGGDFVIKSSVLERCAQATLGGAHSGPVANSLVMTGELCASQSYTLTFLAISVDDKYDQVQLNVSLVSPLHYNQLNLLSGCEDDEHFYGFGAQYTFIDMKNRRLPLFLSEQGVGRGEEPITGILSLASPGAGGTWYTTYTYVPFYLTSYSRALLVESPDYLVYDMTAPTLASVEANNTLITARIIVGSSPLELIESFTALSGRMAELPTWVSKGAILGLQGGTDVVKSVLQEVKDKEGSLEDVAAVWLQDWSGQRNFSGKNDLPRVGLWWNWEVDESHYTNWAEFIDTCNSQGVRVLTYINPLFSNVTLRGTPYHHNYYQEGLDKGFFISQGNGEVWSGYSNSHMTDLSNPMAYQWIMNIIINNMISTNVSGWMCDFGESVPLDADLKMGANPAQHHNIYPTLWGQLNRDAIQTALERGIINKGQASDIMYFMRSGSTLSPSLTRLFWLGDQMVTWDSHDGLATVIIGMLSSGLSGYSMQHSDIGGYTSIIVPLVDIRYIRSKELFQRWCELAAFTAAYRTHLGTLPDENWQFNSDDDTFKHFFRMAKVFKAWSFYRSELMLEAWERGWPLVRHMMLQFHTNPAVYILDLRYQFMLGTELLVAPVYSQSLHKEGSVSVFLPTNTSWVHVWSNTTHDGTNNWVNIKAPLGYPCVLYPTGSTVGKQFVENLKSYGLLD